MTRTAKRGSRLGLMVAGGALVASCAVLAAGLSLRAPAPAVAVAATAETAAVTSPPLPVPSATAAADPPPDTSTAQLEMPPVVLAGGTDPPDAGAPRAGRGRHGKRVWTPGAAPTAPRRAPTEPQIVNEPRY